MGVPFSSLSFSTLCVYHGLTFHPRDISVHRFLIIFISFLTSDHCWAVWQKHTPPHRPRRLIFHIVSTLCAFAISLPASAHYGQCVKNTPLLTDHGLLVCLFLLAPSFHAQRVSWSSHFSTWYIRASFYFHFHFWTLPIRGIKNAPLLTDHGLWVCLFLHSPFPRSACIMVLFFIHVIYPCIVLLSFSFLAFIGITSLVSLSSH